MPPFRSVCFLVAPLLIGLGGCSDIDSAIGIDDAADLPPAKLQGLSVGDEPLAVRAGTDVLAQGGNAADAVTTMFFTMAATYPVAAGLGGGGICMVQRAGGKAQEFDFLPHAANAGGAFAVPGAVRGFYDLQKAYGALPWQRTVSPGETYAATGFPISHSLSVRLIAAQNVVRLDAALAAEFLDESGRPKPEGSVVTNGALAPTMATIRLAGADGFYAGAVAAQISAYAGAQGGAITPAELANTRSSVGDARTLAVGQTVIAMPGPGTGAGAFATALLNNIGAAQNTADGAQNLDAAAATAVRKTLASFGIASLPPDLGATGFAAMDSNGQAAACAVTMNGPFGSGHTAADTGVTLAASPAAGQAGLSSAFLSPMLGSEGGQIALSGAGAGGPNGTAAIAYALLKLAGGQPLGRSSDMRSTGVAPFATVNVIVCQNGACVALADPGGHGFAAAVPDPIEVSK